MRFLSFNYNACSYRLTFWFSMTLWIALTHDVVSLAGLDCPRFVPTVINCCFHKLFLMDSFVDLTINLWNCVLKVGMIAVNDGVVLRNHIPRILKKHFREKPYYVDLIDLFNEVVQLYIFFSQLVFGLYNVRKSNLYPHFIGRISDCFRTDDWFDYYHWRRKRSIQILIVNVSELWKTTEVLLSLCFPSYFQMFVNL